MFYTLTIVTILLGILTAAGAYLTKKLIMRIVFVLIGVGYIAYAYYLLFVLPPHVFTTFPIFILGLPLVLIGMQIGLNIKAKKSPVVASSSTQSHVEQAPVMDAQPVVESKTVTPVEPISGPSTEPNVTPTAMTLPVRVLKAPEKPVSAPVTPVTVVKAQPQAVDVKPLKQPVVPSKPQSNPVIPPVVKPATKPVEPVEKKPFVFKNPDMEPKNKFNLPF